MKLIHLNIDCLEEILDYLPLGDCPNDVDTTQPDSSMIEITVVLPMFKSENRIFMFVLVRSFSIRNVEKCKRFIVHLSSFEI